MYSRELQNIEREILTISYNHGFFSKYSQGDQTVKALSCEFFVLYGNYGPVWSINITI